MNGRARRQQAARTTQISTKTRVSSWCGTMVTPTTKCLSRCEDRENSPSASIGRRKLSITRPRLTAFSQRPLAITGMIGALYGAVCIQLITDNKLFLCIAGGATQCSNWPACRAASTPLQCRLLSRTRRAPLSSPSRLHARLPLHGGGNATLPSSFPLHHTYLSFLLLPITRVLSFLC